MRRWQRRTFLTLVFGTILGVAACASPESAGVRVAASDFGEEWPFPNFDQAQIQCETKGPRLLVTIKLGETWYGLNGAAMGVGGYPDARNKMARHPEWDTYELGATDDLIDRGLALCR